MWYHFGHQECVPSHFQQHISYRSVTQIYQCNSNSFCISYHLWASRMHEKQAKICDVKLEMRCIYGFDYKVMMHTLYLSFTKW